jgi:hypothetical protein
MISWGGREVALLKPEALAELCDFDPRYLQTVHSEELAI